jgi:hypothetical protein
MPCTYESTEDTLHHISAELHRVTRVACDMRTVLRRHGLEAELVRETRKWIAEHDDWDARRIAEETAAHQRQTVRQQALEKLTMDERRVLGL